MMEEGIMNLEEYAAQHPQQKPTQGPAETAQTYHDRLEERAQIDKLKLSISRQLKEGNEPQYILYTAIKAIGILTKDPEWFAEGEAALDAVYADIAQESLLTDRAAIAAQRLDAMQGDYNRKLRAQAQRQLAGYKKIEGALKEVLRALNELENGAEPDF